MGVKPSKPYFDAAGVHRARTAPCNFRAQLHTVLCASPRLEVSLLPHSPDELMQAIHPFPPLRLAPGEQVFDRFQLTLRRR
jgi:hypothetical protein